MVVNKGLSNHFQISHTINMSSIMPSGYRFGATYVGTNLVGPGEAYPVLLGDVDPNGNVNANILHQINDRTKAKIVAQVGSCSYGRLPTNPFAMSCADTRLASCQ